MAGHDVDPVSVAPHPHGDRRASTVLRSTVRSGFIDTVVSADLAAGLLAGYGVAVPIGAIAPLLVTLAARTSFRVGVAAALGVATVDGCYALIALLFGGFLAPRLHRITGQLHWIAAAVLVVIAVWTAVSAWRPAAQHRPMAAGSAFLTLVGLTALNPTTIVYFCALVLGGATPDIVFVLGVAVASASWQLLLVCGGRLLARLATTTAGRRVTALAGSAVIIALAARLIV